MPNFSSLSIKDLLEARDQFHIHLMKKENVLATAISRYRIRKEDPWPEKQPETKTVSAPKPQVKKKERTLENSEVREYSWPCILVFVEKWKDPDALYKIDYQDIVPNCVYMPDGRVVPICVVEAPKIDKRDDFIDVSKLRFPKNVLSGGQPLIVQIQGSEHIASIGCLVTDGNKVYALTNRHVAGEEGTIIYSKMGGALKRIGVTSQKQLGKVSFTEAYDGWPGRNILVNMDAGLIEIDDLDMWKTEVFGIGAFYRMADLNTSNITLDLIGKKVSGYGARSGKIDAEITAMFYRYKSVGGTEYIADFLIGPTGKKKGLDIAPGDSGTLLLMDDIKKENEKEREIKRPFALMWGMHEFAENSASRKIGYALASCLCNMCKKLDVDLIREWNLDIDNTWGKTGHYKIAARACDLVSDASLYKLLQANKDNIGYSDEYLEAKDDIAKAKSEEFIPLADIADLYFRYKRFKTEGSNHYADMDESNENVYEGKTLLDLCLDESNIDIDVWKDFYGKLDEADPKDRARDGILPFRIWQIYNQMVKSLKDGKVDEFICAGGIVSHYLGDTTIPLHVSYLHSGIPGQETKVHSDYENGLLDKNMPKVFEALNSINEKVKAEDLIAGGKGAVKLAIGTMRKTLETLPPMTIIECFDNYSGQGKYQKAWDELGDATVKNLADGCYKMALLWESAWKEGGGENIPENKLKEIDKDVLMDLYKNYYFVQSFNINSPKFKEVLY